VVPDYAKSAATLLLLGTDAIFMSPAAELGPLDVQIEHPDREGLIVSGLDVSDSLAFLARTAIDNVISGGASVLAYTGLSRQHVLHELFQFMAQFLQPSVTKIDPHLVHQAAQQLQVAEAYAVKMLKNRNVVNDMVMDADEARNLMRHLVNHYPAHEFVISRDEARSLGLPVENAETYFRWGQIKRVYDTFVEGDQSLIGLFADSELEDLDQPSSAVKEVDDETTIPDPENAAHRPAHEDHPTQPNAASG
jgi:hypothetical protein